VLYSLLYNVFITLLVQPQAGCKQRANVYHSDIILARPEGELLVQLNVDIQAIAYGFPGLFFFGIKMLPFSFLNRFGGGCVVLVSCGPEVEGSPFTPSAKRRF